MRTSRLIAFGAWLGLPAKATPGAPLWPAQRALAGQDAIPTCPPSSATSCLFGAYAPTAGALLAWNMRSPFSYSTDAGSVCVRVTTDCLLMALLVPVLTALNCPPGQPVVWYTSMPCSTAAAWAVQLPSQSVSMCGSSDCNLLLTYPPASWIPFQNPCPTTSSATSCYLGSSYTGGPYVQFTGPLRPTPVPSGNVCVTVTSTCASLIARGATTPSYCPVGESMMQYFNSTASACLLNAAMSYPTGTSTSGCGTSNCNSLLTPATTPKPSVGAGTVTTPTCPTSAPASCLMGAQGPAAALQEMGLTSVTSTPVAPGQTGQVCVRFTADCVLMARMLKLSAANCPPGQPLTYYTTMFSCSSAQMMIDLYRGQSVSLCGTSDCNAVVAYPPVSWTPFQNPCPSTGSATSCYVGAFGSGGAAAYARLAGPPVLTPTSSGSLCVAQALTCDWMNGKGVFGTDASKCPSGESVAIYGNTTASDCLSFVLSYPVGATYVCGTSNCNGPVTTTSTPQATAGNSAVATSTCPATSSATSCYSGATGTGAAAAALASDGIGLPVPTAAPSGYLCVTLTLTCEWINAHGDGGSNSSTCPVGESVTTYSPMPMSTCPLTALYYPSGAFSACGTSNCNSLVTTTTTSKGAVTAGNCTSNCSNPRISKLSRATETGPSFTLTALLATIVAGAWPQK